MARGALGTLFARSTHIVFLKTQTQTHRDHPNLNYTTALERLKESCRAPDSFAMTINC